MTVQIRWPSAPGGSATALFNVEGSSLPHNGMQRTVLCFAAEPERWANHDDGVEFARWRRVQEERTLGWQHH
jgi:hypothetical protein